MRAHETIVTPRADWMLLRMHYLRILAPLAAVVFGVLIAVVVAVSLAARTTGENADLAAGLDLTALVLAGMVAMPVGAAVFSRPFKEQYLLLFHALPVSRLRQWTIFVTASLLALLTVYAGLALLRPGAARMLISIRADLPFLVFVAISFATGLCISLIFVRTFAVYLAGYIASIAMPALVTAAVLAPYFIYRVPGDLRWNIENYGKIATVLEPPPSFPIGAVWAACAILIIGLTAASAAFYVRGEVTLPRLQIRNGLLVVAGTVLLAMIVMLATYTWPRSQWRLSDAVLSPDGRRFAIRYVNYAGPWEHEMRVRDLVSGKISRWEISGLVDYFWNDRGEIVGTICDVSPLRRLFYLRPSRDRIERWSADGVPLGADKTDGEIIGIGHEAVVVRKRETAYTFELRNGVRGRELFRAPSPDTVQVGGGRVLFRSRARDPQLWRLSASGATEIPRVRMADSGMRSAVFDGQFYSVIEVLLHRIDSTWPVPRASGDRVGYFTGFDASHVYAVVGHPSTLTGTLQSFDAASKQWSKVSDAIPLAVSEMPRDRLETYNRSTTASITFGSQYVLFAERSDKRIVHRVYDAVTRKTTTLYERTADDPRRFSMYRGWMTMPRETLFGIEANLKPLAEFRLHEGIVEPVPIHEGGMLEAIWPDGTQVRRHGHWITLIGARGSVRRVSLEQTK